MSHYNVVVRADSVRVFADGREVAQAVPTSSGVFHAVNVGGKWTGYEHESGVTLTVWAERFTA